MNLFKLVKGSADALALRKEKSMLVREGKALLKRGVPMEVLASKKVFCNSPVWSAVREELGRFAQKRALVQNTTSLLLESQMEEMGIYFPYIVRETPNKVQVHLRVSKYFAVYLPIYYTDSGRLKTKIVDFLLAAKSMQQFVEQVPRNWRIESLRSHQSLEWTQVSPSQENDIIQD